MTKIIILFIALLLGAISFAKANDELDYEFYHLQVIKAEILIGTEHYNEALYIYDQLFSNYEFVFLREYKIATQLAFYLNDRVKGIGYLKLGILSGWTKKSIKRNKYLTSVLLKEDWKAISQTYSNLHEQYEARLNQDLRKRVQKMYSKDQRKALMALFRFGDKVREKYAEKKFVPHSESQMAEFAGIMEEYGYPGEKLIGNNFWMSTILSHHNSISTAYVTKDTLYSQLKPALMVTLKHGNVSPFELGVIDDWYRAVKFDRTVSTYGILDQPPESEVLESNKLRSVINLRPIETRKNLLKIQQKTGLNFYLPHLWY